MIDRFMNNEIKIIKKDSKKIISGIKASVQSGGVYINQNIPIEKGDTIEYINPAGLKEILTVERVDYPTGPRGEFHHIEIKYRK